MARRAGVAKGTIYLHFADKEALFEELIRIELGPVVGALEQASHADISLRQVTDQLIEVFVRGIFETRRKDVIRLVITEGPRFPKLAEFYYREVISRVLVIIRAMLRRAFERGELKTDALVRYPQLLAAPGIVAIIWSGLFDRFEPIDIRGMMRAHFDVLLGQEERIMIARRIAILGAALLALAACSKGEDPGYQGWVEADLIFVSPDESGRVETLSVREGDNRRNRHGAVLRRYRVATGRRRHGQGIADQRDASL